VTHPLPAGDVLRAASSAIGKIDLFGRRGITMVSADEIEAMALMLAALGVVPTIPGRATPDTLYAPL
jgi:hypothetical protein